MRNTGRRWSKKSWISSPRDAYERVKTKSRSKSTRLSQRRLHKKKGEPRNKKRGNEKGAIEDGDAAMDVDADKVPAAEQNASLLSDPRFTALFEDPDFEVDEKSREYALLNPSAVARKKGGVPEVEGKGWGRGKTAVEDEEEESDKVSSDDMSDSDSESLGSEDVDERGAESEDSSEAGGTAILLLRLFTSNL
jgi:ribosome biogenesis protein ENP2